MSDQLPFRALREAEQAIIRYLSAHPEFFKRHPELVETLRIPHACGPAVSLLEYQVQVLREKNTQLRQTLEEWVEVVRENSDVIHRLQRLTLVLIAARDLAEMLQGIEGILQAEFKAEYTRLCLSAGVQQTDWERERLLSPAARALFEPLLGSGQPLCGRLTRQQAKALFGELAPQVASAALVPLRGGERWQGLLAIGSQAEDRFHPGMGTLFLSCMGELISHALQTHLPASAPVRRQAGPGFPLEEGE